MGTTYTWYGTGSTGSVGGSGNWDNTDAFWTAGSGFTTWTPGSVAAFGGSAGTVTLTSGQSTSGLMFGVGGYTLKSSSGSLTLASGTVITTTGGTDTIDSTLLLAGAGGVTITKTGAGTFALTTANTAGLGTGASPVVWTVTGGTYSGGLFSSELAIGAGNNIGVAPTNNTTQVILDSGTLRITGTTLGPAIASTRAIQVNAAGGAIVDTNGNPYQGNIIDNASSSSSLYLSNSSGTTSISGTVSGTGGLTWNGAGTLSLTTNDTFGGGVVVNSGAIKLPSSDAYTGGTTVNSTGSVVFSADASLGAAGSSISLAGGTLVSAQTASIAFSHLLATGTTGGTIQLDNGAATSSTNKITLGTAQQITGSGAITVTDNGVLSIGASNSGFSGNWTLDGGVTELTSGSAAGTGSITITNGAELSTLGSQINNPLSINNGTIGWDFYSGSGAYQGTVSLGGAATVALMNYYGAGSMSGTISGSIIGGGGLTTVSTAGSYGGSLTLSGTGNAYSGGTTIGLGTYLHLASGSSIGSSGGSLSVAGTFDLNANNIAVASLASQGGNFYFNLNGSGVPNQLTIGSGGASLSGTTGFEINTSSASTISVGSYTLMSSTGGGLGGSVSFAGGQVLTVPATTSIQNIGGTNYKLTLASSASAVTMTVAPAPSKTITIMPLGSSITAGQSAQDPYNGGGYRSQLYQSLVDDGRFTPEFVGSSTANLANDGTSIDLMSAVGQTHHEGHPGYTTTQTLNNLNGNDSSGGNDGGYWLASGNGVNPNYITLNIGGNDFVANPTDATAIGRLKSIITEIASLRPNATIVVSSIMYRGDGSGTYGAGINTYYNPYIPGLVYAETLAGLHVQYVDMYSLITPGNSLALIGPDLVHPIQAGYDDMGTDWYNAITTGQAFFSGTQGSTLDATSGSSTNWTMDYAGTTDLGQQPGSGTDVYFNGGGSGTLVLGQNYSVRSVNFTSGQTASVNLSGTSSLTIGAGGITVQAGTGAHTISAAVSLGGAQTWSNISSSPFTVSGAIGGSGALAIGATGSLSVASTGRFVFSGNNGYSGNTTINGGTLEVDNATGSGTGTGTVTVMSGATLSGSGSISGNVDVKSGGTLAPGTSASTAVLTLNNLNLESGSDLSLQLGNPSASDYLQTNGSAVTFTGANLSLQLLGTFVGTAGTTYTVIENNAMGTFSSQFAGLPTSGSTIQADGTTFSINYTGGDGNDVTLTVAPEPGSLGLAGAAAGLGLLRRRRRTRSARRTV